MRIALRSLLQIICLCVLALIIPAVSLASTDICQGFDPGDKTHTAQQGTCVYMTAHGPVSDYNGYLFYGACIDVHNVAGSLIACDQLQFPDDKTGCAVNIAGTHSIQDSIKS